ncbi:MAG: hypothetical protein N3B10_11130 [Armatimonadetes bacterium]|nr:hypothetical protein [Armatimonadota bacterium]MCS7186050.1 hypothetical protein [Armatimonadota bacterium]MCX7969019.1 hypothetical protein [Armatimonadota bacterium]MDW8142556.1 hypothetical protein [Armatimonadota bacterium]MDW8142558.1 hypothetical protein [Armatimonadota bacterium]
MRRILWVLLVAVVGLSVVGCRRSAEEQGPPPGAVKEPPGMGIQAPGPGERAGGGGMEAPFKRPGR